MLFHTFIFYIELSDQSSGNYFFFCADDVHIFYKSSRAALPIGACLNK